MSWPTSCILRSEPLANHTSFRIGGPAEWFAKPSTIDELIAVLREASLVGLPVSVVGGGTNTLAADRGVKGLVVNLGSAFRTVEELNTAEEPMARVRCGAALLTQRLVKLAAVRGWGELDILAGLPGQLGGAVVMNAQGIGRFVERVCLVSYDGTVRYLDKDQFRFQYRYTDIEPGIIAEVELAFPRVPDAEARENIRQVLQRRNDTQDLRLPSAGCAFRNPQCSAAGKLIDDAGLKGSRIGDAQVSTRHANFIVNVGQATANDVLALMEYVQRRVRRVFGVVLEPEVRMIGESWR